MKMHDIVMTIPAYEPTAELEPFIRALLPDFRHVLVVDDGSRRATACFERVRKIQGVTVVTHPENRGKGAALKTAFAEILRRFPDATGTITADADGQHRAEDVLKVADSLTRNPDRISLGVRTFGSDTPWRSRLGNLWTCGEFFLLTGAAVRDTQTGLRGLPTSLLPKLLTLPGDRYEYEIRMLTAAVLSAQKPLQVPIATVYSDGNSSSHFRPLVDTWRTQTALFSTAVTGWFGRKAREPSPTISS